MTDEQSAWYEERIGTLEARIKALEEDELAQRQISDLWQRSAEVAEASASLMPTEHDALQVMFDAYQRLRDLGWDHIMYCPKDGSTFDSISAGSTSIHPCFYQGGWPDGHWWVLDGGDVWPAHPILYRLANRAPHDAQADG